jgi:hypothetical protein
VPVSALLPGFAHDSVVDEGTHFIGKPFSATDLARTVREVIDSIVEEVPIVCEEAVNTDTRDNT